MILLNKQITKVLISPRGCAGWFAHLLFANPEGSFYRIEAHLTVAKSFQDCIKFVFLVSRDCCVALPGGAMGLSADCDCGIS